MSPNSHTNTTRIYRHSFRGILTGSTEDNYHSYLLTHAFDRYRSLVKENELGTVLALCANYRDAEIKDYPFSEILLTGIGDRQQEVSESSGGDHRVSYQQQNGEKLPFDSASFDVVFCKEGLHHLVRPVLGLYEMLRVARKGVILIEPFDCWLGRCLDLVGATTLYERSPVGNLKGRDNYVFRWSQRTLEQVLNGYYLDSGYYLELHPGWFRKGINTHRRNSVRIAGSAANQVLGLFPGCRGNLATALILPGNNIPPDPGHVSHVDL